jgi:hypothetical protein
MRVGLLVWGLTLVLWATGAQAATPLDSMFTGFLASLPLYGQVIIGVGGLGLAALILWAISNPAVLMYVLFGFIALALIGMAASGTLASFFMGFF